MEICIYLAFITSSLTLKGNNFEYFIKKLLIKDKVMAYEMSELPDLHKIIVFETDKKKKAVYQKMKNEILI